MGGTACVAGQGLDGEAVGREEEWMNTNELSHSVWSYSEMLYTTLTIHISYLYVRDVVDEGQSWDERLVVTQRRIVIHDAVLH